MTAETSTERAPDAEEPFAYSISEYPVWNIDRREAETVYSVRGPDGLICSGIPTQRLAEDIASLPILQRELDRLRLVPVRRSEDDRLESICQLLVELLAVQRHNLSELREIRAALAADDRKDSFSFDNNASAGKIKIGGKRYAATIDEARADAELEFARGMALIEETTAGSWRETANRLEAKRKADGAAWADLQSETEALDGDQVV